ncbi:hypothetical protein ACN47E_010301 [Coniothyrium glycines]
MTDVENLSFPSMDNGLSTNTHSSNSNFEQHDTTTNHISEKHVEALIASLPLVRYLRSPTGKTQHTELRLHGSMHPRAQAVHLMGSSLHGPNKLIIDPHFFRKAQTGLTTCYIGSHLCGHPGFVHGGFLFSLFDDIFARCAATAMESGIGMTAHMSIDYRSPPKTDRVYVARSRVVKVEGRKVWVSGSMRCLEAFEMEAMQARPEAASDAVSVEEEEAALVAEATALFIEPKFAGSMVPLFQSS